MSDQVERALAEEKPTTENEAPLIEYHLRSSDATSQSEPGKEIPASLAEQTSVDQRTVTEDREATATEPQRGSSSQMEIDDQHKPAEQPSGPGEARAAHEPQIEKAQAPEVASAEAGVTHRGDIESGEDESHQRAPTDMESGDEKPHEGAFKRFRVEYAKSGRSRCRAPGCNDVINKGEIRVAKISKNPFPGRGEFLIRQYHLACLFESFDRPQTKVKLTAESDLEGLDSLRPDDQQLVRDLIAGRKKPEDIRAGGDKPAEKAPEEASAKAEERTPPKKPAARGRGRGKAAGAEHAEQATEEAEGPAAAAGKRLTRQKRRSFAEEGEEEEEAGGSAEEPEAESGRKKRGGRAPAKGGPKAGKRKAAAGVAAPKRSRASAQP